MPSYFQFAAVPATISSPTQVPLGTLREACLKSYRHMLRGRLLEDKLAGLYRAGGRIVGGVYLGRGQEAFSASLAVHLTKGKDIYGGLIRDQAGRMAFGESILDCTRTYLGSAQGPMRGRDGNIHRGRPTEGMPAMISHLGSMVSVIAGMLLARRLQSRLGDAVGATSIGDGATSTGAFHEGLNMAAVEKLPVIISVANNQYAYSTPNDRQFACESLVSKAQGYGIEGYTVDGTDLAACVSIFQHAVARARAGHGPQMIVGTLLRLSGHGEHDDASYVPDATKKQAKDCILLAEQMIQAQGWMSSAEITAIRAEVQDEIEKAVTQTSRESAPDPFRETWQALSTSGLAEGWEVK